MQHLIRQLIFFMGGHRWADRLIFRWQQFKYAANNRSFRKKHPGISLPDDYTLYESYRLHYQRYFDDGKQTAQEIIKEIQPFLLPATVLDWGCGPCRISRHFKKFIPDATVFGCDTNADTISWNQAHIPSISFQHVQPGEVLPYADNSFDLIIGFSVLTHIPASEQLFYVNELYRILQPGGMIWISTQGKAYINQLSVKEKEILKTSGMFTRHYPITGHRMMSTYHDADAVQQMFLQKFVHVTWYDGTTEPSKAGKQDLWVLQK